MRVQRERERERGEREREREGQRGGEGELPPKRPVSDAALQRLRRRLHLQE